MKTEILMILLILFSLMGCMPETPVQEISEIPSVSVENAITQAQMAQSAQPDVFIGEVMNPPILLQDFEMPSSTGENLHLADLRGSWLVIFFGYLHCPDFCPLTLVEYERVKRFLGDDAERIKFVYISVDGARDTPDAMRRYLSNFDDEFIGLTGDDQTLARIQPDYGFYYLRRLDGGNQAVYTVDHSTKTYIVDPNGYLVATIDYGTSTRDMTRALLWYLNLEEA